MREQRNIQDMSDRELRAYRRRLRRQREIRKRCFSILVTICLIAACVISYRSLTTSANTGGGEAGFKYYTRITVHSNDTLWELADDYIDYRRYNSKQEYINEVCSINRLEDADEIVAGQTIVVPYYSADYVK